jgi:hypothetical protein
MSTTAAGCIAKVVAEFRASEGRIGRIPVIVLAPLGGA